MRTAGHGLGGAFGRLGGWRSAGRSDGEVVAAGCDFGAVGPVPVPAGLVAFDVEVADVFDPVAPPTHRPGVVLIGGPESLPRFQVVDLDAVVTLMASGPV